MHRFRRQICHDVCCRLKMVDNRDGNLAKGGLAIIDVVAAEEVDPDACPGGSKTFVFLHDAGANDRDCDVNGIPDECEPDTA